MAITVSHQILARLLPFHLLLDPAGLVLAAGPSLAKLVEPSPLIGAPVFDVLRVVRPQRFDASKGFQTLFGKRLSVEIRALGDAKSSLIFGIALELDHGGSPHIFLALTPSVNARTFIEEHGLKISDFGPADGSADIAPLLAMQEDMLEDGKKKSLRLEMARDAAERLANHDALTGLPNRRALMEYLNEILSQNAVTVLHLDLDKFKEINDSLGHAAGDAALKHTASAMVKTLGREALCARLGGDEFVGVLNGQWPASQLHALADRLIAEIMEPFAWSGEFLTVGASVGIASARPEAEMNADKILHHADLALYEVKRLRRGKALICTPELLAAQDSFQNMSADIRRGIREREFVAYLQPQVMAESGEIVGMEALVRWQHPERGLLTPGDFLAVAERADLIQELDGEMRRSALDALVKSDHEGTPIPKVSLNATIRDLTAPMFSESLVWELDARNLHPSRVSIEIVESVFFDKNATQITEACKSLTKEGFSLSLDDFGTGHASALSLVNLPLSAVKIDRAFAAGVAADPQREAMARSLVGMATTLDLEVIAEGVVDDADVKIFQDMGCRRFQSFHFARPMEREAAFAWIKARTGGSAANLERDFKDAPRVALGQRAS
ncbi:MAG: EAL domain-containing protein [Pseudomonadota bacterium]